MAHLSLSSLQAEIAAQAAAAYGAGVRFYVICEGAGGEWFALHADDQGHAGALARHWVDILGCRGASCWRLYSWGSGAQPFFTYLEDPSGPEDYFSDAEVIDA
jgi:hypothetical protein